MKSSLRKAALAGVTVGSLLAAGSVADAAGAYCPSGTKSANYSTLNNCYNASYSYNNPPYSSVTQSCTSLYLHPPGRPTITVYYFCYKQLYV